MKKEIIQNILDKFAVTPITYDVYIIANAQNKTCNEGLPYIRHACEDEFFSRTEFSEIVSAIFNVYGYAKVFYSEIEFLNYILENKIQHNDCFVYNLSRDGIHAGKKSLIPSICDLVGINYTGSNAFVISLLRNKFIFSNYLKQFQIPTPQSWLLFSDGSFPYGSPPDNKKIIVKSIQESASIGMQNDNIFTFNKTLYTKNKFIDCCKDMKCEKALVQEFISGLECEVLVLEYENNKYKALDPIAININNNEIINTQISNTYDYSFNLLSKIISNKVCNQICASAEKAASLLGIETYARFDFRIDKNMNFFLIDIAGTPYTIKHSSICYLFEDVYGFKYNDIYKTIGYLTKQKHTKEC